MKPHKCPVCNGEGERQNPNSNLEKIQCKACKGTCIVWEFELNPVPQVPFICPIYPYYPPWSPPPGNLGYPWSWNKGETNQVDCNSLPKYTSYNRNPYIGKTV